MQLRCRDIAGLADGSDRLTARDRGTARHIDTVEMGVGGHPVLGMLDQQEIAVPPQLIPRIGYHTVFRSPDRRPPRYSDIDAVIVQPLALGSETGDHLPAHRPEEPSGTRRRARHRCPARRCPGDGGRARIHRPTGITGFPGRRTRRHALAGNGADRRRRDRGNRPSLRARDRTWQIEALPRQDGIGRTQSVEPRQPAHVHRISTRNGIQRITPLHHMHTGRRNTDDLSDLQDIGGT